VALKSWQGLGTSDEVDVVVIVIFVVVVILTVIWALGIDDWVDFVVVIVVVTSTSHITAGLRSKFQETDRPQPMGMSDPTPGSFGKGYPRTP
jgi:hypothetical protein